MVKKGDAMKIHSVWFPLVMGACVCSASFFACSSSSSTDNGGANNGNDGGSGNTGPTSCATSALKVLFSPMYSAFDGKHTFQVPAVVDGIDNTVLQWSASDSSMVTIAKDDTTGGAMITTQKAGTVTIIASGGGLCGTSVLTITQASPDDYDNGSSRYNDGVSLAGLREAGVRDAAAFGELACTNCHGDNANGLFKDVAHTPEQTGGFSDQDLINIFTQAQVPDGGYFDPNIVSYQRWQTFHQWDMTPDEAKGIVIYLRGLTPEQQNGSSNFGGRRDGGFGDGGRHRRDGGGGPPPSDDSGGGSSNDAAGNGD
jgi:hypothetical protein